MRKVVLLIEKKKFEILGWSVFIEFLQDLISMSGDPSVVANIPMLFMILSKLNARNVHVGSKLN